MNPILINGQYHMMGFDCMVNLVHSISEGRLDYFTPEMYCIVGKLLHSKYMYIAFACSKQTQFTITPIKTSPTILSV